MNFGQALEIIKQGGKVARGGWNGQGVFLELRKPTSSAFESFHSEFIVIDTTNLKTDNKLAPRTIIPWAPSQTDMLAEDWYGIGEEIKKSVNEGTLGVYGTTLKHTHIKPRKDKVTININVNGLDRLKPVSEAVDEAIRKAYDRAYKELKADLESSEDNGQREAQNFFK